VENRERRVDIFKILSHETKRRIIKFIGDDGHASFIRFGGIELKLKKLEYDVPIVSTLRQIRYPMYVLLNKLSTDTSLLLFASDISVAAKVSFRKNIVLPSVLHYISSVYIYVAYVS